MENAQRLDEIHESEANQSGLSGQPLTDGPYPGRSVPADWFLDPADPDAGRRLETGTSLGSLEDQATAFLVDHGVDDADAPAVSALDVTATVTALHPGTVAPLEAPGEAPGAGSSHTAQPSVWLGLPGLADPLDVDGELAWQVDALCAQTDPEAFFPEKGGSTRDAKKVCSACTVRSECLEYALGNDERFGIWGGLSERERRRLRKRSV
ncbi:WhiB family transcriptional regulator [Citricoccus sp.]|uniref:WhiB family transcriptional regulator n=1 Tax=Citricoccus sp. TaxID=1978372 RepID=UPI0028BDB4C2|nr:WhiB family transcriptional regulator [Citricoccus sp.]